MSGAIGPIKRQDGLLVRARMETLECSDAARLSPSTHLTFGQFASAVVAVIVAVALVEVAVGVEVGAVVCVFWGLPVVVGGFTN